MSLIIKGIRAPKACRNCRFTYFTRGTTMKCMFVSEACKIRGRLDSCPLFEIPTPHGRLIDADELTRCVEHAYGDKDIVKLVANIIERQPTIIEAEVE